MTTPGSRPRKGFLASFQAAMAPIPPEDDGSPIARPRVITVSSVLIILAAVCFLFTGGYFVTNVDSQANLATQSYVQTVNECKTYMGGIGTAVPSTGATTPASASGPVAATDLPKTCPLYVTDAPTAAQIDTFRSTLRLYGIIFILVGLGAAAAGWYIRNGARWARRVLVGIALLSLAGAALLGVSTTLTLLATLLLVVGLILTYIGKGGLYYGRIALRRKNAGH